MAYWHHQESRSSMEKEQQVLEERKKIAERRKEIQKQREIDQLNALADPQSAKKNRLEWMYASTGPTSDSASNDDYLLGKKRLDEKLIAAEVAKSKRSKDAIISKFGPTKALPDQKDQMRKEKDDPLAFMQRGQKSAIKKARSKKPKAKGTP